MVRQIVWVQKAQEDRKQILAYWFNRNKSKTHSKKLDQYIRVTLNLIGKYPLIGKKTDLQDVRIKTIAAYLLIYQITETRIVVLRIWDSRRNPAKLQY